ncbi:hypothetical protein C3K47_05415 [Solitalea longa]|uniref:DUF2867 domain-containing protein n=1 Tax=Solitalea longa TaxID=2079460 RepID=A0A2S5A777_9SPHI|nr:hypothetical protein [Solitalea longa]POY37963.1 hypothetical protein C3K47_05415 [Solitalea longa]
MLQDKYLRQSDFSKSEFIEINAPIDKVYLVVETLNFEKSRIIYWLFKLRGIPVPESLTLKGLEKINFVKLETIPNKEIILGLIGQFWTPTGRLKKFKPEEFINFDDSTFAKATWNFELTESNDLKTRLNTETRIFCPTTKTKKKFKIYWTIIQPFSSWIRKEILRAIKNQAENN